MHEEDQKDEPLSH